MRMLCMFDLPVDTPNEKRQYRIFRKELLRNGFTMLQYSVYYRAIQNRAGGKKYEKALKQYLPVHGEVRLISVSEKQFNDMQILVGSRSKQEELVGSKDLVCI
ncbi:CRISPR-associated endonuclease Cas2 [Companilactobacillus zhachilii]|uniref:CRISPR-associated endonuclease Cas2 n=1 Tax=Companilactobacillus zhachilii TaxID=2304606 RepID=UPI001924ACB9|nr:CRISPR-associated endonuclease Cas2 [Companilactobacillus zhachilii]MBL3531272.1 CRISPR-associated endonuclease Cas2 [Companilactobacillus zhachilii]